MKTIPTFQFPRRKETLVIVVILLLLSGYAEALAPEGTIHLSWPINRSVIQRNGSNQANFFFAGQFEPWTQGSDCPSYNYYYQIERLNLSDGSYSSTEVAWTQFFLQSSVTGIFYNYRTLSTGWYDLKIKATKGSGGANGTQVAFTTVRFGVGDVYVIAGQSNAQGATADQGFNNPSQFPSITPYDCVNVHNFSGNCLPETDLIPNMSKLVQDLNFRVGPNGHNAWNWAALGRLIGMHDNVPTSFFNAAAGGSSVEAWRIGSMGGVAQG